MVEEPLRPSETPVEVVEERRPSKAFRIFSRLPFRIEHRKESTVTVKKPVAESPEPLAEHIHKQLTERTDILECAWTKELGGASDDDETATGEETLLSADDLKAAAVDANGNCNERVRSPNEFPKIDRVTTLQVYVSWIVLALFGYFRDFLERFGLEKKKPEAHEREELKHFAPLYDDFAAVYTRHMYSRVRDVFERPICSTPGARVTVCDRTSDDHWWSYRLTGTTTETINVSSYNYLGFAENDGPCARNSTRAVDELGLSSCNTVHQGVTREKEDMLQVVGECKLVSSVSSPSSWEWKTRSASRWASPRIP